MRRKKNPQIVCQLQNLPQITLKENVIREAGKYRINVYIKQIWKDSLPTASEHCKYTNLALYSFRLCIKSVAQDQILCV